MIRLVALLALLLAATPALALESNRAVSAQATVSLVSDADAVAPGRPVRLGLLIRLAPGWHTYWKNPGDAGAPPELRLDLPRDASAGPLAWPTPAPLREGPLVTYAYTGEVLLPLTVTPGSSGLDIGASADWLVCKDICIPQQATFRLDLPQGRPVPSAEAPLFAEAERRIPRSSPWAAHVAADGTLSLRGPELGPATVARAWFMPDQPDLIDGAAAQGLRVTPGMLALALTPAPGFKPQAGLSGVVVVRDRAGLETAAAVHATPGPLPPTLGEAAPLWRLWGLAFLGGAILNLMPCVFPVLALKAIGLARGVRAHAASYTAGILAAFAAMGGALMAARSSGSGWGFQFASPAFVAATAWVMLAIGLNLAGIFRVGAGRLAGAGQGWATRGGHVGSFATGLLAVLVATPCTAPFMAGAVAGALAAPPAATLSVFVVMGLGLAAPYAVLACVPGLTRLLPAPGRWMERLRNVLALPMFGAAAWLLWVLGQEAGTAALGAGLAGSVLIGGAAWLAGASQQVPARSRRIAAGAAALVLAALALLPRIQAAPQPIAPAAEGSEAFTPLRLAALRQAGRPVFVDMTAAWCVTCLVNERVAIDTQAVRQAFQARNVAYLKGDWTRQDPGLTGFLRENGRDGVPLYLFYPAHADAPTVLPQVLTAGTVLAALGEPG